MSESELNAVHERLTELEVKASYSEDLLDALNDQLAQQSDVIDRLKRELSRLSEQVAVLQPEASTRLQDELPPHY